MLDYFGVTVGWFEMTISILVLNGPNLNLLGMREPETYGQQTLSQINDDLAAVAADHGIQIDFLQSNAEHVLVDKIQQSHQQVDFIIFNPAAFTHTSIALRDALLAVEIPFIEIHLSDPLKREAFRHHSYFTDIAVEVIKGKGPAGYQLALQAAIRYCRGTFS